MAKTRRRYSSRRRARGRKVKHSVKRRVHKKRNNRGKGKSKRRSRGRKHSRRMRGGQNNCQGNSTWCCKFNESTGEEERKSPNQIQEAGENFSDGQWKACE